MIAIQGTAKVKKISIRQNGNIRNIERVREHHRDLSLRTEEGKQKQLQRHQQIQHVQHQVRSRGGPYSRLTGEIGGFDRPAQGVLGRGGITLRCRHARVPQQPLDGEQITLGRVRGRREPMSQRVESPLIP